jgi:hypothetical protein
MDSTNQTRQIESHFENLVWRQDTSEVFVWLECGDCGYKATFPNDFRLGTQPPCLNCGSTGNSIWGFNKARPVLWGIVRIRHGSKRHKTYELFHGRRFGHDGNPVEITREIDNANPRMYREKVIDLRTHEVIREVEELLSQHRSC